MKQQSPIVVTSCLLGIILAACGLYFGGMLPLFKAQAYIDAQGALGSVQTVQDFETDWNTALDLYSPVGQPETAQFLAGDVTNIVETNQSQDVSDALVSYVEPYLNHDEVIPLLILGQLHQVLWQAYGQDADYQAAVGFYVKAHTLGPDLPPPLYSLLALYAAHEDAANTRATAKEILALWPNDTKTQAVLASIPTGTAAAATNTTGTGGFSVSIPNAQK